MAIYMKYGDIKGAVTTDGFKDWIELNSFQWGQVGTSERQRAARPRESIVSRASARSR